VNSSETDIPSHYLILRIFGHKQTKAEKGEKFINHMWKRSADSIYQFQSLNTASKKNNTRSTLPMHPSSFHTLMHMYICVCVDFWTCCESNAYIQLLRMVMIVSRVESQKNIFWKFISLWIFERCGWKSELTPRYHFNNSIFSPQLLFYFLPDRIWNFFLISVRK